MRSRLSSRSSLGLDTSVCRAYDRAEQPCRVQATDELGSRSCPLVLTLGAHLRLRFGHRRRLRSGRGLYRRRLRGESRNEPASPLTMGLCQPWAYLVANTGRLRRLFHVVSSNGSSFWTGPLRSSYAAHSRRIHQLSPSDVSLTDLQWSQFHSAQVSSCAFVQPWMVGGKGRAQRVATVTTRPCVVRPAAWRCGRDQRRWCPTSPT
jgi:hypothetical protein